MLKKTITYKDFNDVERTEDHYFNLTDAELTEMEASVNGGLSTMIRQIIASEDVRSIVPIFKDIILKSYGVKSPDGKRFIKFDKDGHRLADDFVQTNAYSKLFMEVGFDPVKGPEFILGIIPAERAAQAQKAQAELLEQSNG